MSRESSRRRKLRVLNDDSMRKTLLTTLPVMMCDICSGVLPVEYSALRMEPMLVPAITSTGMRCSSSQRMTPISLIARAPPPPMASPITGRSLGRSAGGTEGASGPSPSFFALAAFSPAEAGLEADLSSVPALVPPLGEPFSPTPAVPTGVACCPALLPACVDCVGALVGVPVLVGTGNCAIEAFGESRAAARSKALGVAITPRPSGRSFVMANVRGYSNRISRRICTCSDACNSFWIAFRRRRRLISIAFRRRRRL